MEEIFNNHIWDWNFFLKTYKITNLICKGYRPIQIQPVNESAKFHGGALQHLCFLRSQLISVSAGKCAPSFTGFLLILLVSNGSEEISLALFLMLIGYVISISFCSLLSPSFSLWVYYPFLVLDSWGTSVSDAKLIFLRLVYAVIFCQHCSCHVSKNFLCCIFISSHSVYFYISLKISY